MTILAAATIVSLGVASESTAKGPLELRVEAGAAWQSKNDVQIPNNDTATRFSLYDLVGAGPVGFGRLYIGWNITGRHELWGLAAPFQLRETAPSDSPINFAGSTFVADEPIDATFQFNSWRATYRYRFEPSPRWKTWVGFTAKLRDARVELRQGDTRAKDTDLGFVPLLHLGANYALNQNWTLYGDLDGLAGGPGRAIDATAQLQYSVDGRWFAGIGYRTLEGGADVDAVYSFAWLHYAVLSIGTKL